MGKPQKEIAREMNVLIGELRRFSLESCNVSFRHSVSSVFVLFLFEKSHFAVKEEIISSLIAMCHLLIAMCHLMTYSW